MTDIFKSNFTLKFKAQKIEEDYDQMRNKNMRKYNITYSIINLILSIIHSLVYSLTYFEIGSFLYYYIKYTTYILTGIHVICLMTTIIAKKYLIHIWISRVNNFTIFMNFLAFRIYVGSVA